MNTLSTHRTLHPVQWVAAVAVTLLAVTGIAAITGLIPISKSAEAPAVPPAVAAAAPTPVAATPVAETPAPTPQVAVEQPAPIHHHHHVEHIASAEPAPQYAPPPPPPSICNDCGRIESVQRIVHEGEGSGAGAVAGGVLGGALGNGVGQGNGRVLTTIAGVIGGAMLGNHVEKSQKQSVSYQTTVRFDDGSTRVFNNPNEQGFRDGERVRLVNGSIQPE